MIEWFNLSIFIKYCVQNECNSNENGDNNKNEDNEINFNESDGAYEVDCINDVCDQTIKNNNTNLIQHIILIFMRD